VLASRYPRRGTGGVTITLIESRQQPPIGVGEGTWPTIRTTLKQIGVTETDFLRECDALSSKDRNSSTGRRRRFGHLLAPVYLAADYADRNLAPYWLEGAQQPGFAPSCAFRLSCAPVGWREADHDTRFAGLANYATISTPGNSRPFYRDTVSASSVSAMYTTR